MRRKLGIMCGSSNNISTFDKEEAKDLVLDIAKKKRYDFVMGISQSGIMKIVKDTMIEYGSHLTEVKRENDGYLFQETSSTKFEEKDSLERTRRLYEESDIILFLSGGFGSRAEFYGMVGLNKEQEGNKIMIVYNKNGSYDLVIEDFENLIQTGYIKGKLEDYFKVVNTKNELLELLEREDN